MDDISTILNKAVARTGETGTPTRHAERTGNASWFHVFRSMFESGDVAEMGPATFTVYAAIKATANHKTGQSFPSIDTIVAKTGVSEREVKRCLKRLEDLQYIAKERRGRHNVYRLREKVVVEDDQGRPTAVATWDYLPATVKAAQAELQRFVQTGKHLGQVIYIEHLHLQANIIQGHHNVQVVGDVVLSNAELEGLNTIGDPDLRERMQAFILKAKTSRADPT